MKTSKFFLSTLIAAAAMTSTAYAEINATTGDTKISENTNETVNNLTENIFASGSTLTLENNAILNIVQSANGGCTKTWADSTSLEGNGQVWLWAANGNAGWSTTYDLSSLNASGFSGVVGFGQVGDQNGGAILKIMGQGWGNAEVRLVNNTYTVSNLQLQGDTSIAGLTTSDAAFKNNAFLESGSGHELLGSVTAVAGTTLTLTGGDTDYTGYSNNGAFVYNGAFGTSTTAIGLNVTGGNQTFGGTNYVSSISVSGGELALTGTNTISGMVFVMGGELSVSGDSVISGTVGIGDMGSAAALSLGGTVALSGTISVGDKGTLTFENGVEITADSTLFTDVVTPEGNGYATVSITIYSENGGTITNGSSFEMVVNEEKVTVNNGVVSGATDYSTYYVNADNAATSSELASSNTALKSIVVQEGLSLSIDQDYTWGTYNISGNATIATDATVDVGNVTSAKMDYTQLKGDGTVKFKAEAKNHAHGIKLGSDFTGTVIASGYLNLPRDSDLGGATKIVLGDGNTGTYLWTERTHTYGKTLNFEVNGEYYASGTDGLLRNQQRGPNSNITYEGSFTLNEGASFGFEEGTTTFSGTLTGKTGSALYVAGATVNVSGNASLDTVNVTSGTLNVSSQDISITTLSVTGGTTNFENTGVVKFTAFDIYSNVYVKSGAILDLTENSRSENRNGAGTLFIDGGTVIVANDGWGKDSNFGANYNNNRVQLGNNGVFEVTETPGNRGFSVTSGIGTYRFSGTGEKTLATTDSNNNIHLADDAHLVFDVKDRGAKLGVGKVIQNSLNGSSITTSTGGLIKQGEGTLLLSGENLYSGGTTISKGKLIATNANALGTGDVTVSGGQLSLNGDSAVELTNAINIVLTKGLYADAAAITGTGTLNGAKIVVSAADQSALETLVQQGSYKLWDSNITVSSDSEVTYSFEGLKGYTYSVTDGLLTFSAIPEPSAFGLLAGVGALALVAARRRRRK